MANQGGLCLPDGGSWRSGIPPLFDPVLGDGFGDMVQIPYIRPQILIHKTRHGLSQNLISPS